MLIVGVVLAGEVISCLENASALQCMDLNELSVTLDLYVLTLPVEIEVIADFHHNRSTKNLRFPFVFELTLHKSFFLKIINP